MEDVEEDENLDRVGHTGRGMKVCQISDPFEKNWREKSLVVLKRSEFLFVAWTSFRNHPPGRPWLD